MKVLYKAVDCVKTPAGFAVLLDGKQAKTPLGAALALPNAALADAVAEEWRAQKNVIRKDTMPLTQIACIALDFADARRAELCEELLGYAATDLVCYRAGSIPELEAQQEEELRPVIDWAERQFGITLNVTNGLMPVAQPAANEARLKGAMDACDRWKLAALAAAVKPLGSLVLALALVENRLDAAAAFRLSQLEEAYETARWGEDDEKQAKTQRTAEEINAIERYLALLRSA